MRESVVVGDGMTGGVNHGGGVGEVGGVDHGGGVDYGGGMMNVALVHDRGGVDDLEENVELVISMATVLLIVNSSL